MTLDHLGNLLEADQAGKSNGQHQMSLKAPEPDGAGASPASVEPMEGDRIRGGRTGEGPDFQIEPLVDHHLPEVLIALRSTFREAFDEQWFAWKHRENPRGPSQSWVAVDSSGVIGVRLLLAWTFVGGRTSLNALRPCDTVTVPQARRRGVFRALTDHAMRAIPDSVDVLFNTPNEQSLPGYLKMGFQIWMRLRQHVGLVPWSRAHLVTGASVMPKFIERAGLSTCADSSFLTWRYISIPHRAYEMAALRDSDEATGAIYRVRRWRGSRMLVISEIWGPRAARRTLLGSIARMERSLLVRVSDADRESLVVGRSGSPTFVTHKPMASRSFPPPLLSIGDVEDVL